jgi:hypothetical protein
VKRLLSLLLVLAALCSGPSAGAAGPEGDLYLLGIALNEHGLPATGGDIGKRGKRGNSKSESLDDYICFPREFEKVFQEQGKEFSRQSFTRQITGRDATYVGIMDGLAWLRTKATTNDRVVLYYTSHGSTSRKEGWSVITADGETLWGHEIKAELAKVPCHVLFFLETCHCGAFGQAHKKEDPPVPDNVTVLCAVSPNQSASNEIDIAALEALWGRADFNRDGVVDLDELLRYVEGRYKEWAPPGKDGPEVLKPVLIKAKTAPASLSLTRVSPQLGAVGIDGEMYSALVTKQQGNKFGIHILGYDDRPGPYFVANTATRDQVCLPNEGPPLLVKQKGTWYPARLVSREGDKFKVHYLGYNNEEEVVTGGRVKYPFMGQPQDEKPARR